MSERSPLAIRFTNHTSGYINFKRGVRIKLAGPAIFSGYKAAKVFGVTSATTRIIRVKHEVAITTPASPKIRTAIIVAMAEAKILTKLFPIKIRPISLSGRFNNRKIRYEEVFPDSAR